jgi:hypothetical protein
VSRRYRIIDSIRATKFNLKRQECALKVRQNAAEKELPQFQDAPDELLIGSDAPQFGVELIDTREHEFLRLPP